MIFCNSLKGLWLLWLCPSTHMKKNEATGLRSPVCVLADPYFSIHISKQFFPILRVRMKFISIISPKNVDRLTVGYVKFESDFFSSLGLYIRKTYSCSEYPLLNPTFIIVKLVYAGVYLIFLVLVQNIDCGYSLEQPQRGGSIMYPRSMF